MTTNERTVGRYLRWLLAALSLGAGVIHFAVSGEHYDVSWAHGTFFAVVAWPSTCGTGPDTGGGRPSADTISIPLSTR